jgi:hypothetical protein
LTVNFSKLCEDAAPMDTATKTIVAVGIFGLLLFALLVI